MPAPTSPRKRALMPSTPLRSKLRGHGHHLNPIVQIGKEGPTPAVLAQLAQALFDHELVKVKIGSECPVDRFAVADELSAAPGAQIVQILGRTVLVYKRHPQKPRFEGARAAARAAMSKAAPPARKAKRPSKAPTRRGPRRGR